MGIETIVNIILSVMSFILAFISVAIVIMTLKQNNKMLEINTRPYIVAYVVYQETLSHLYLCIKNYGNTSAIIKSFVIKPSILICNVECNSAIKDTMLAPNQQLHFILFGNSKEKFLNGEEKSFEVQIKYDDCCTGKSYEESYSINTEYINSIFSAHQKATYLSQKENSLQNIESSIEYIKNSMM